MENGHSFGTRKKPSKTLEEVRELWDRQQNRGRFNEIFEIEAMGPLISLGNLPKLFREALWHHFIDNAPALSSLIKLYKVIFWLVQRGAKYRVCKCSHGLTVCTPSRTLSMGFPGESLLDRGRSSPQLSQTPCFELSVKSPEGGNAFTPTRCWQFPNREDGSTSERGEELGAAVSISHANPETTASDI